MDSKSKPPLTVVDLGTISFVEALQRQEDLHQQVKEGRLGPHLILCSHPPVITLGTSSDESHILASPEELVRRKIEVIKTTRGGNVTYHGLGQLVAYLILDLKIHGKKDVGWYMRSLEEVAIRTLAHYSVQGRRISGKTGVWLNLPDRKIASLGVRLRRWCTLHGLALNIHQEDHFSLLNPCGLEGVIMTSLEQETLKEVSRDSVAELLCREFKYVFSFS